MADIKTKPTNTDVHDFINSFAKTEQKKKDSFELLKLMQDFTGYEPKMWGASIIGFGRYRYKSERSRQEGDWPLVGFSPRKQPFLCTSIVVVKDKMLYSKAWANTRWEKAVSISKDSPILIRKF